MEIRFTLTMKTEKVKIILRIVYFNLSTLYTYTANPINTTHLRHFILSCNKMCEGYWIFRSTRRSLFKKRIFLQFYAILLFFDLYL